jgi:hypothetical protein
MLPVEIYKTLAKLVATTKCYLTLSLLCKNPALGCRLYIKEISNLERINVQIAYNFSGHNRDYYWHFEHSPICLSSQQLTDAINRDHVGCNTKQKYMRCDTSRYYMIYSDEILWYGQQRWNINKAQNNDRYAEY